MSFASESARLGREPLIVVEIDLPYCGLTYGSAPCTAAVGVTGSVKCFNTYKTCQDPTNFDGDGASPQAVLGTTKTYRFCEMRQGLPVGVDMIPCIESVDLAPTKIIPDDGLGHRASITITLSDFTHHDRGIDKYVTERTYNPAAQGTYFGKLITRNKSSYLGRPLRIRVGYLTSPFDWNNFQTRAYIIDRIDGPDEKGKVKIVAKDVLKRLDDALIPEKSSGALASSISAADVSLTLDDNEDEYPSGGGYVRIGSEIIQYASRTGTTVSGLTRGTWGTTAATHAANDNVQLCVVWENTDVVDILEEIERDYAGIVQAYIPKADWDVEQATWLSGYRLTNIISKPEKVKDVVKQICQQALIFQWWDERDQEIKLKTIAPTLGNAGLSELDEEAHIISASVEDDLKDQITTCIVYFDRINFTEDNKPKNYRQAKVFVDADAESTFEYDRTKSKTIFADWLGGSSAGNVLRLASRTVSRLRDGLRTVEFELDAKDSPDVWAGDDFLFTSGALQDFDGSPMQTRLQAVSVEDKGGSFLVYTAISTGFSGRYGFIAPNGTPDFDVATADQKQAYGFISDNSGLMGDGSDAYKIT